MNALDLLKYQTDLANTAHQREVADLKAAGLNPVLSAGGSGADVPNVMGAADALSKSSSSSAKAIAAAGKANPINHALDVVENTVSSSQRQFDSVMRRLDQLDDRNNVNSNSVSYRSNQWNDLKPDYGSALRTVVNDLPVSVPSTAKKWLNRALKSFVSNSPRNFDQAIAELSYVNQG